MKTPIRKVITPHHRLVALTKNGVELWRPVVGAEGLYAVSNLGRVRSQHAEPYRILKPTPINGYPAVQICTHGKRRCCLVHVLMLEAFVGLRPEPFNDWEGAHEDGVKANNTLDNLKWCTCSVNGKDKAKQGQVFREKRTEDGVDKYQCTKCREWKSVTEFGPLSPAQMDRSVCGIQSRCIPCAKVTNNEYKRKRRQKAMS